MTQKHTIMFRLGFFNGGGDPPPKKQKHLSFPQINQWSEFVEKNPSNNLMELYSSFNKSNPGSGIEFDTLRSDLDMLKQSAVRLGKQNNSEFGENVHTGLVFPRLKNNGKDMGRINSMMQTENQVNAPANQVPDRMLDRELPGGVEEAWWDDKLNVVKYIDPQSGDIRMARKENLNHPLIRKSVERQQADLESRGGMGMASALGPIR